MRGRRPAAVSLLAAPAAVYLLVAFAAPLLVLLATSVVTPTGLSVTGYVRFLSDPFGWKVLANSLRAAALTTTICLLVGYPVAVALVRARGAVQSLLLVSLILPLSVGAVVKAFAWTILLRSDGLDQVARERHARRDR